MPLAAYDLKSLDLRERATLTRAKMVYLRARILLDHEYDRLNAACFILRDLPIGVAMSEVQGP
jgi:hypothetical protein